MTERLSQNKAEEYWQKAASSGLVAILERYHKRDKNSLMGAVFERLGLVMVRDLFLPPEYTVPAPRKPSDWRFRALTPDQERLYAPRFPDGLILHSTAPKEYELSGFVEYKMPNFDHLITMQNQLAGFNNLHDLLRNQNSMYGRRILRRLLGIELSVLTVPDDMPIFYVVPQERSIEGIPSTLADIDRIKEIKFPMTTNEIHKRVYSLQNQLRG